MLQYTEQQTQFQFTTANYTNDTYKSKICYLQDQKPDVNHSIYMLQILHTRSDMKYYCNRQLDCHIPQFQ